MRVLFRHTLHREITAIQHQTDIVAIHTNRICAILEKCCVAAIFELVDLCLQRFQSLLRII